jgi:hypothetical protein
VDHFDGRGRRIDVVDGRAGELARRVREERAHALAAAERRVTHRLGEPRGAAGRDRQRAIEHVLDAGAMGRGPVRERGIAPHDARPVILHRTRRLRRHDAFPAFAVIPRPA